MNHFKNQHQSEDGGNTGTHSKAISVWMDGLDWILLRKPVLLEHLAVLAKGSTQEL